MCPERRRCTARPLQGNRHHVHLRWRIGNRILAMHQRGSGSTCSRPSRATTSPLDLVHGLRSSAQLQSPLLLAGGFFCSRGSRVSPVTPSAPHHERAATALHSTSVENPTTSIGLHVDARHKHTEVPQTEVGRAGTQVRSCLTPRKCRL